MPYCALKTTQPPTASAPGAPPSGSAPHSPANTLPPPASPPPPRAGAKGGSADQLPWFRRLAQRVRNGITLLTHNLWGQTTAEYALVLLGAATVAMLLTAWAGQTNRIGSLFDAVLRSVSNLIT